jgi:hypothetical protein
MTAASSELPTLTYIIDKLRNDAAAQASESNDASDKMRVAFTSAMASVSASLHRLYAPVLAHESKKKEKPGGTVENHETTGEHVWKHRISGYLESMNKSLLDTQRMISLILKSVKKSMNRSEAWHKETKTLQMPVFRIADHQKEKREEQRAISAFETFVDIRNTLMRISEQVGEFALHTMRIRRADRMREETGELIHATPQRDASGRFVSDKEGKRKEDKKPRGPGLLHTLLQFVLGSKMIGAGFRLAGGGVGRLIAAASGVFGGTIGRIAIAAGLGAGGLIPFLIGGLLIASIGGVFGLITDAQKKGLHGRQLAGYVARGFIKNIGALLKDLIFSAGRALKSLLTWENIKGFAAFAVEDVIKPLVAEWVDIHKQVFAAVLELMQPLKDWVVGAGMTSKVQEIRKTMLAAGARRDAFLSQVDAEQKEIWRLTDEMDQAQFDGDTAKVKRLRREIKVLKKARVHTKARADASSKEEGKLRYDMDKEKVGWFAANWLWMKRGVGSFFSSIGSSISGWFDDIYNWSARQVKHAGRYTTMWKEQIAATFSGVVDGIAAAFQSIQTGKFAELWEEKITATFRSVIDGITAAFQSIQDALVRIKDHVVDGVSGWLPSWLGAAKPELPKPVPALKPSAMIGSNMHGGVADKTASLMILKKAIEDLPSQQGIVVNKTTVGPSSSVSNFNEYHSGAPSPFPQHSTVQRSASFANGM